MRKIEGEQRLWNEICIYFSISIQCGRKRNLDLLHVTLWQGKTAFKQSTAPMVNRFTAVIAMHIKLT